MAASSSQSSPLSEALAFSSDCPACKGQHRKHTCGKEKSANKDKPETPKKTAPQVSRERMVDKPPLSVQEPIVEVVPDKSKSKMLADADQRVNKGISSSSAPPEPQVEEEPAVEQH